MSPEPEKSRRSVPAVVQFGSNGKNGVLCARLDQCLKHLLAQAPDFKPRSYLLPTLEALSKHVNAGVLDELEMWSSARGKTADVGDGGLDEADTCSAAQFHGYLIVDALADALNACLITFAFIEDRAEIIGSRDSREAVWWTSVSLRAQAQRLCSVQSFFEAGAYGIGSQWESAAALWDPTSLFLSGALSKFWKQHIGRRAIVPVSQFLSAIDTSYEMLSEADRAELREWLLPDEEDLVSVVQVALVLDGPGLWRGILLCTSWPELCPRALLQAVLAGGKHDALATPAKVDSEEEIRQQQSVVLLPEWSRARLQRDRAAFHALRSVGMILAADDARGEGLLVQFPNRTITQILLEDRPTVGRILRELLDDVSFVVRLAAPGSLARSIVDLAASRFKIAEARDQHITLSRVHARKVFELRDDAEDLLCLQRQHQALLQNHLQVGEGSVEDSTSLGQRRGKAAERIEHKRPSLLQLQQENRSANLECQELQIARYESEIVRNAEGSADEPPESQLAESAKDAAFASHESVLMMEINMCINRRICMRLEISRLEHTLVELEATFAEFRRQLVRQDEELSRRIAAGEEELARLCERLAFKREAARTAADAVLTTRMELAEKMVPLPAGPVVSTEAMEAHLKKETEVLQQRNDVLEKRYKAAKAMAKKR